MQQHAVATRRRTTSLILDADGRRLTRRNATRAFAVLLVAAFAACSDSAGLVDGEIQLEFDFSKGIQGWVAGFADYPVGKETEWAIGSSLAPLPAPLDASRSAILLTGVNHSDDLFMYLTRGLTGLAPNASYSARFHVTLATNAPKACAGIGGAPGESVVLKVGATATEPGRIVDAGQYYRATFDYGSQLAGGRNAASVGDLATSNTNCSVPRYELKEFDSGSMPLTFRTDGSGRLWLIVGIDSGFEGTTAAYVTAVRVELVPR